MIPEQIYADDHLGEIYVLIKLHKGGGNYPLGHRVDEQPIVSLRRSRIIYSFFPGLLEMSNLAIARNYVDDPCHSALVNIVLTYFTHSPQSIARHTNPLWFGIR